MVEMGQNKVFVQELGLKQGVLADTNMDYLTGTPNFKADANFDVFPQNIMGKKLQNELWACPVPLKWSERRPPTLFLGACTENGKKWVIFAFWANYSNAKI